MTTTQAGLPPPPGYRLIDFVMGGAFTAGLGPLYLTEDDRGARIGLRIAASHCNGNGVCHGGLLATFADLLMPVAMYREPRLARMAMPTASLQLDYIGAVKQGDFIEGEGQLLKATRSLVFGQGLVRVDGKVVLRCSGVYKIVGELHPASPGLFLETATTGGAAPPPRGLHR